MQYFLTRAASPPAQVFFLTLEDRCGAALSCFYAIQQEKLGRPNGTPPPPPRLRELHARGARLHHQPMNTSFPAAALCVKCPLRSLPPSYRVAHLLSILHPAEAAALEAAATVEGHGEGPADKDQGLEKPVASDTILIKYGSSGGEEMEPQAAALSAPQLGPRLLPAAALSARALRRRASAPLERRAQGAAVAAERRSPALLHAVAALREGRVSYIAGPYRMASGLREAAAAGAAGTAAEAAPGRRWRAAALSVVVRACYVVVTTAVAVVMPFFG